MSPAEDVVGEHRQQRAQEAVPQWPRGVCTALDWKPEVYREHEGLPVLGRFRVSGRISRTARRQSSGDEILLSERAVEVERHMEGPR